MIKMKREKKDFEKAAKAVAKILGTDRIILMAFGDAGNDMTAQAMYADKVSPRDMLKGAQRITEVLTEMVAKVAKSETSKKKATKKAKK